MKTVLLILVACSAAFAQRALNAEDALGGAERIEANIDLGSVKMTLKRVSDPAKAFKLHYEYQQDEEMPELSYEVDNSKGTFHLSNGAGKNHFPFTGLGGTKDSVDIELAEAVPISLYMNFGVCDASVDLGGMKISDAIFSTGVCSFDLNFSAPNKIDCSNLQIKTGISSVTVENLSNARAGTVEFDGGLGSMKINFGGRLVRDCTVTVKTGFGSVEISVPSSINTVIKTPDSFLTSVDVAGFYSQGGGYYRSNSTSGPQLKIYVDSALGGITIKSY